MYGDSGFPRDILDDRCQRAEFFFGKRGQLRVVEVGTAIVCRQSVYPAAAIDAVLMGVEVDLEIV